MGTNFYLGINILGFWLRLELSGLLCLLNGGCGSRSRSRGRDRSRLDHLSNRLRLLGFVVWNYDVFDVVQQLRCFVFVRVLSLGNAVDPAVKGN